jgi:hypothetical protein
MAMNKQHSKLISGLQAQYMHPLLKQVVAGGDQA